jgi:SOS-response transcriptional repressor LexA
MHIGTLIKSLMKSKGVTTKAMSEYCGVTPSAVSSWFSTGRISKENMAKAAELLKVSTDDLISGAASEKAGNVDAARQFKGEVPVISWVQAGSWQDIAESFQPEDAERMLPVFRGHRSNSYALRVRGDSMTAPYGKSYPAGCYVIVDPEKRSPNNGDRVIAMTPGSKEATFKVFKDEDGVRWLAPLNNTHPTIKEPFEVLGSVIGKWEDE